MYFWLSVLRHELSDSLRIDNDAAISGRSLVCQLNPESDHPCVAALSAYNPPTPGLLRNLSCPSRRQNYRFCEITYRSEFHLAQQHACKADFFSVALTEKLDVRTHIILICCSRISFKIRGDPKRLVSPSCRDERSRMVDKRSLFSLRCKNIGRKNSGYWSLLTK